MLAVEGDQALVALASQSACGSCAAKSGCGTSVLGSLFPKRHQQLRVDNSQAAKPGDRVVIGLPEAGLQRASLLLYGVPLLGLIAGAVAGDHWGGSEPQAILGGLFGSVAGLWWVRHRSLRAPGLQPVMMRRLPPEGISLASLQPRQP